jgi:hypothetical protein
MPLKLILDHSQKSYLADVRLVSRFSEAGRPYEEKRSSALSIADRRRRLIATKDVVHSLSIAG